MQIRVVFDDAGEAMHISRKDATADEPYPAIALQWHAKSGNSWKSTMRPCYLPLDGATAILDASRMFLRTAFSPEERDGATHGDLEVGAESLTDEARLDRAKTLLREAAADFYKDVVNPNASYEMAKTYVGWACRLLVAIFGEDTEHARDFLVRTGDDHDHRLRKNPAAGAKWFAETLAVYSDHVQLPPGVEGQGHLVREDFVPEGSRRWLDY